MGKTYLKDKTEPKNEKVSIYMTPSHKELVDYAARKQGLSSSSFIVQAALRAATSPEEK